MRLSSDIQSILLVAIVLATACPAPKNASRAPIDCTKADQDAIAAEAATLKKSVSWTTLEGDAGAAGETIGGCALLAMVREYEPAPGWGKWHETPEEAIEHVRRHFGGVTWITKDGER